MYSAKILGKQMDAVYGLYLPEYVIPAPEAQTNFVEIVGRDGALDKSEINGVIRFNDRVWSLIFKKTGENVSADDVPSLSALLMNDIHGRRGEVIFDDDDAYKWVGRVFVQNVSCEQNGLIIVKVQFISEPYKYGVNDIVVVDEINTEIVHYQGDIATFDFQPYKGLTSLVVNVEPVQDLNGYDYPWPAGGGVNIWDEEWEIGGLNPTTGNTDTSVDRIRSKNFIPCESDTSYYFVVPSVNWRLFFYDENYNFVSYIGTFSASRAITTPSNAKYIKFWIIATSYSNDIAINYPSSVTTYSPYSNICPISGRTWLSVYVSPTQDQQDATTYAVDWTSEAGTVYGGTLDVVSGVLKVDRAMVDMGTVVWSKTSSVSSVSGNVFFVALSVIGMAIRERYAPNTMLSSAFATAPDGRWFINQMLDNEMFSNQTSLFVSASLYDTPEDFKAAVTGVQLCYELATPITYQLTPQEVTLLAGQNNVWADTGEVDVALSVMDHVVLHNGRKPIAPKVTIISNESVTIMFTIKGVNKTVTLAQGDWKIPDLILFEGDTDVYEAGEGIIKYSYVEASL